MNDIFKNMQAKVGCEYISDLPSYKRKVWQEMKRLNPADYEERQLEDFSKYVFGMPYQTLKDVMKQQKGREEQCRKQGCWWKRKEQLAKKQYHTGSTCIVPHVLSVVSSHLLRFGTTYQTHTLKNLLTVFL